MISETSIVGKKVLVVGDAILDRYLIGSCNKISPEAPVPVVNLRNNPKGRKEVLGGAANVAANVASLGGLPTLISLVNIKEAEGLIVQKLCKEAGVNLAFIDDGRITTQKTRVIAQGQQMLRMDYEDTKSLAKEYEISLLGAFSRNVEKTDVVVISDYAKGLITEDTCQKMIDMARSFEKPTICDPKPQHFDFYYGCSYITPNVREIHEMTNFKYQKAEDAARYFSSNQRCGVLLTKGEEGITLVRGGSVIGTWPAQAREVFDVSGAGDTVVAAFSLAIAARAKEEVAIQFANKAAGVVVGKHGTATVKFSEIEGVL